MLIIDIKEAETNFEKYIKLLEDRKEKEIIILVNKIPTMVMKPYDDLEKEFK